MKRRILIETSSAKAAPRGRASASRQLGENELRLLSTYAVLGGRQLGKTASLSLAQNERTLPHGT
jgi:hypothetical protein